MKRILTQPNTVDKRRRNQEANRYEDYNWVTTNWRFEITLCF